MKKQNSLNLKQNLKKGDDVLVKSSKSLKAFISLIAIILSFSIFVTPASALIGSDDTIVDDSCADTLTVYVDGFTLNWHPFDKVNDRQYLSSRGMVLSGTNIKEYVATCIDGNLAAPDNGTEYKKVDMLNTEGKYEEKTVVYEHKDKNGNTQYVYRDNYFDGTSIVTESEYTLGYAMATLSYLYGEQNTIMTNWANSSGKVEQTSIDLEKPIYSNSYGSCDAEFDNKNEYLNSDKFLLSYIAMAALRNTTTTATGNDGNIQRHFEHNAGSFENDTLLNYARRAHDYGDNNASKGENFNSQIEIKNGVAYRNRGDGYYDMLVLYRATSTRSDGTQYQDILAYFPHDVPKTPNEKPTVTPKLVSAFDTSDEKGSAHRYRGTSNIGTDKKDYDGEGSKIQNPESDLGTYDWKDSYHNEYNCDNTNITLLAGDNPRFAIEYELSNVVGTKYIRVTTQLATVYNVNGEYIVGSWSSNVTSSAIPVFPETKVIPQYVDYPEKTFVDKNDVGYVIKARGDAVTGDDKYVIDPGVTRYFFVPITDITNISSNGGSISRAASSTKKNTEDIIVELQSRLRKAEKGI